MSSQPTEIISPASMTQVLAAESVRLTLVKEGYDIPQLEFFRGMIPQIKQGAMCLPDEMYWNKGQVTRALLGYAEFYGSKPGPAQSAAVKKGWLKRKRNRPFVKPVESKIPMDWLAMKRKGTLKARTLTAQEEEAVQYAKSILPRNVKVDNPKVKIVEGLQSVFGMSGFQRNGDGVFFASTKALRDPHIATHELLHNRARIVREYGSSSSSAEDIAFEEATTELLALRITMKAKGRSVVKYMAYMRNINALALALDEMKFSHKDAWKFIDYMHWSEGRNTQFALDTAKMPFDYEKARLTLAKFRGNLERRKRTRKDLIAWLLNVRPSEFVAEFATEMPVSDPFDEAEWLIYKGDFEGAHALLPSMNEEEQQLIAWELLESFMRKNPQEESFLSEFEGTSAGVKKSWLKRKRAQPIDPEWEKPLFPYLWKGKAWRSHTGYEHDKGVTAADVVKFESEELGNNNRVHPRLMPILAKLPAKQLVWVTKNKKRAAHYGDATEYPIPAESYVIGMDGDGGYWVLLGGWRKKKYKSPKQDPHNFSLAEFHHGPGPHPSGTPQSIHAGKQDPHYLLDLTATQLSQEMGKIRKVFGRITLDSQRKMRDTFNRIEQATGELYKYAQKRGDPLTAKQIRKQLIESVGEKSSYGYEFLAFAKRHGYFNPVVNKQGLTTSYYKKATNIVNLKPNDMSRFTFYNTRPGAINRFSDEQILSHGWKELFPGVPRPATWNIDSISVIQNGYSGSSVSIPPETPRKKAMATLRASITGAYERKDSDVKHYGRASDKTTRLAKVVSQGVSIYPLYGVKIKEPVMVSPIRDETLLEGFHGALISPPPPSVADVLPKNSSTRKIVLDTLEHDYNNVLDTVAMQSSLDHENDDYFSHARAYVQTLKNLADTVGVPLPKELPKPPINDVDSPQRFGDYLFNRKILHGSAILDIWSYNYGKSKPIRARIGGHLEALAKSDMATYGDTWKQWEKLPSNPNQFSAAQSNFYREQRVAYISDVRRQFNFHADALSNSLRENILAKYKSSMKDYSLTWIHDHRSELSNAMSARIDNDIMSLITEHKGSFYTLPNTLASTDGKTYLADKASLRSDFDHNLPSFRDLPRTVRDSIVADIYPSYEAGAKYHLAQVKKRFGRMPAAIQPLIEHEAQRLAAGKLFDHNQVNSSIQNVLEASIKTTAFNYNPSDTAEAYAIRSHIKDALVSRVTQLAGHSDLSTIFTPRLAELAKKPISLEAHELSGVAPDHHKDVPLMVKAFNYMFGIKHNETGAKNAPFENYLDVPNDTASMEARIGLKKRVAGLLSKETGLAPVEAAHGIRTWAISANDENAEAYSLQRTAARIFGSELSPWQKGEMSKLQGELDNTLYDQPLLFHDADSAYRSSSNRKFISMFRVTPRSKKVQDYDDDGYHGAVTSRDEAKAERLRERFLRSMYNHTQRELKAKGIDHVILFRGETLPDEALKRAKALAEKAPEGSPVTLPVIFNPMSSWTVARNVIKEHNFGNSIWYIKVPRQRILSTPRTGFGCLAEGEFVLLGRKHPDTATLIRLEGTNLGYVKPRKKRKSAGNPVADSLK